MRKFSAKQKLAAALGAGAMVVAGAGVAVAFWTTTGNGSGSATTASSNGTITLHATLPSNLAPGQSGAVTFSADNGGATNLELTTLSIDSITVTPVSGTCASSNFGVGSTEGSSSGSQTIAESDDVLAGASGQALSTGTTLYFHNTTTNQDDCKGAQVTLNLSSV